MSAPRQKTDILLDLMRAGDWPGAIALGSTFKLGFEAPDRAALKRAHEAHGNARFYTQLGRDPVALIEAGKRILVSRYGARV